MRLRKFLLLVAISIIAPIAIGGISGAMLRNNSESYPTRELAEKYYFSILETDYDIIEARNDYREVGLNGFGHEIHLPLNCSSPFEYLERLSGFDSQRLPEGSGDIVRDARVISRSVAIARTTNLETGFDDSAIDGFAWNGVVVGSLSGCRYSPIFAACDAIGRHFVRRSLTAAKDDLAQRKSETRNAADKARCSALDGYNDRLGALLDDREPRN